MKGIIMAGGEGSRLRPLTCDLPKPMVPIMNRPVMTYSIELLNRHNIDNIGVTLQYLPHIIQNYYGKGEEYGVSLEYFIEDKPLGTAGSVKNGEHFLDETFIVISGDALTDIDLSRAIEFHRKKGAMVTLILKKVEIPLEYGVVITDRGGSVTRFLEKPNWGEVFSDTVNTGIYILEPEVLDYMEPGKKFDFSRDLFPMLLEDRQPIYGYITDEYWCDIGSPKSYIDAHFDMLTGRVKGINMDSSLQEIGKDIWIGIGCDIHPSAVLEAPCYIGGQNYIGENVHIGPYTVLGRQNIIGASSNIAKSVIWNNTKIGNNVELKGAAVCNRVNIERRVRIYEDAVIGAESFIGKETVIRPSVKIWPCKSIGEDLTVSENVVWGNKDERSLFKQDGIIGQAIMDINPSFASRLGAAYGSTLEEGNRIGIAGDGSSVSAMIKHSLISGILSVGLEVFDLGDIPTPSLRYSINKLNLDGGVRILQQEDDHLNIQFMGRHGINIKADQERSIQNLFLREDFSVKPQDKIGDMQKIGETIEFYSEEILSSVAVESIKKRQFKILMADKGLVSQVLSQILEKVGCDIDHRTDINNFKNIMVEKDYDLGIELFYDGEQLILYDEEGNSIRDEKLLSLITLVCLKHNKGCKVVAPYNAPNIIEDIAEQYMGEVIRTKTSKQSIMEAIYENIDEEDAHKIFRLYFDCNGLVLKILETIAMEDINLSNLVREIPDYYMRKREIDCPWEWKGRIIRSLIEDIELDPDNIELNEGVKVNHRHGWALILPDNDNASCRIYSQGYTEEYADELADFYELKIKAIKDQG